MSDKIHPVIELLQHDQRYHIEAYEFVRDALSYAQDSLKVPKSETSTEVECEHHITGQQLCEAIRQYALNQYGFMAKTVLASWGIQCTGDFGEIVYNMIRVKLMRKSDSDRREDFNDVYSFEHAFDPVFELSTKEDT